VNYHVFRNGLAIASPLTPGYMDTGLNASTTYAYYVTAFYNPCPAAVNVPGCADSDASNTASVTTPPDVTPVVSVAILPPSANVAPGKQQQFTATVTGNTNTAVTWSTTAGSVTQAGLFTAGPAGVSTVKATSVADSTKSASASVTVAAPASGFTAGDRVKTLQTANVRSTAPVSGLGTLLGTVPKGSLGTVGTAAQVPNTGGWIWVQVKFDVCAGAALIAANCTGYVGSDNLVLVTPVPPPTPTLTLTCTPTANTITCIGKTTNVPAGSPYTVNATVGGLNATATGTSK
jgi:hypothetical protein